MSTYAVKRVHVHVPWAHIYSDVTYLYGPAHLGHNAVACCSYRPLSQAQAIEVYEKDVERIEHDTTTREKARLKAKSIIIHTFLQHTSSLRT